MLLIGDSEKLITMGFELLRLYCILGFPRKSGSTIRKWGSRMKDLEMENKKKGEVRTS